ncbi:hypothetical protein BDZ89DRAFT_1063522 [Hymenopellis radicata]|nr:hypothetical protein BDZ89DRAFT_1063522 [Hymenopellis radicata]
MTITNTTDVELCPRCHASITLTSPILPFEGDFARAYCNPSRTESSSIESSLTDPSVELTTLAQEIQRVELLLRALKTHHAHLERHIHRTTHFIQSSPIRQLPTEVLGIIFASACTSFQEDEYKTPLSISLVCSKWRDISISTPALWTNIYVAPYSSACGVPVYEHFLQRCGGIPISVKVKIPDKERPHAYGDDNIPYEETYDYHVEVVGDVYASFAQWKHAEFHMKRADVQLLEDLDGHWLHQMEQLNASLLESLTLAITDAPGETLRLPSIFSDAPLLATVNFLDCCESQYLFWADARLPWRQLRRVQTDEHNAAELRYLDKDFQDGESRTLILNGSANFYLFPQISFTLHITTLILNSQFWTYGLSAFFRNISIPTLEDLTVISRDLENKLWINPLLVLPGFLQSSRCKLSTFCLVMHGQHVDTYPGRTAQPTLADSLVDALRDMGHLKYLQVIEADLGPPLLNKRLFEQLSTDALLPELTSLELVWAEDRQPDRELLSALSSRADGCLSSVVLGIRNGGNLVPEVLECMRGLRQRNVQATCW